MEAPSSNYEMRVPAVLSIIGSLFMIITYLIFPRFHTLKYMEIIFYVSLNDLIASIGVAIGYVNSGSIACWIQGITTNYNYLSSILWTVVLSYDLFSIIKSSKPIRDHRICHIICWGFPLLTTLLPLSTNTIATPKQSSDWCFIGNRYDSPAWGILVWEILSFYLWVWLSIIFIIYLYIRMFMMLSNKNLIYSASISKPFWNLSFFPLVLIFTWGFTSIVDIHAALYPDASYLGQRVISIIGTSFAASQGFLNFIIFVLRNKTVRLEWMYFFTSLFSKNRTSFLSRETFLEDEFSAYRLPISSEGIESSSLTTPLIFGDHDSFDNESAVNTPPQSFNSFSSMMSITLGSIVKYLIVSENTSAENS